MTMADVESACCTLITMTDGVENPRQTRKEYYKSVNHHDFSALDQLPHEDWNEPMWKIKMYHFVTFCEMNSVRSGLMKAAAVLD